MTIFSMLCSVRMIVLFSYLTFYHMFVYLLVSILILPTSSPRIIAVMYEAECASFMVTTRWHLCPV